MNWDSTLRRKARILKDLRELASMPGEAWSLLVMRNDRDKLSPRSDGTDDLSFK